MLFTNSRWLSVIVHTTMRARYSRAVSMHSKPTGSSALPASDP
jgi:hypothetical protein